MSVKAVRDWAKNQWGGVTISPVPKDTLYKVEIMRRITSPVYIRAASGIEAIQKVREFPGVIKVLGVCRDD